ncbi:MAG: cupin domain-containing protein [Actinomycetota bacterium]|nr:cupin domain-containing protein [Actinomycetota bacterium]
MRGSFDQLPADELYAGVLRRTFSSSRATVTLYSFEAGAEFPRHRHPQEQITVVEAGEAEITIGDRTESLSAGGWAIVEPEVEHGLRAGPAGARVLAVVVPRRDHPGEYTVLQSGADA